MEIADASKANVNCRTLVSGGADEERKCGVKIESAEGEKKRKRVLVLVERSSE